MHFAVIQPAEPLPTIPSRAYLIRDNWNDWFQFLTQFYLVVVDERGERRDIGNVKIGQFGISDENPCRPHLPGTFESLRDEFFSVGQDDSYYEALNTLGPTGRARILRGLRDFAVDLELFESAMSDPITKASLLRYVSPVTVRTQFHRMALGYARLTPYEFRFEPERESGAGAAVSSLTFSVSPESEPPTNIHVIIGRNGVGKTRLLRQMARSLIERRAEPIPGGRFVFDDGTPPDEVFANLVSVTFSAFDPFAQFGHVAAPEPGVRYAYVGLQREPDADGALRPPKDPVALTEEFVRSVEVCRVGAEAARWRRALEILEADPLFRHADVRALAEDEPGPASDEIAANLFRRLSSGHKVVLLTITKLVELVDERTLILLDEPEAHLHPPLLAAFVRALSDLLLQRNGVAIVATHSPVVLQEVPRTCVWMLRRVGVEANAERPDIETFGENVGVLTREVFGLEVTESGFHRTLRDAVNAGSGYEAIDASFGGQLGAEARAIVRALIAARDEDGEMRDASR